MSRDWTYEELSDKFGKVAREHTELLQKYRKALTVLKGYARQTPFTIYTPKKHQDGTVEMIQTELWIGREALSVLEEIGEKI